MTTGRINQVTIVAGVAFAGRPESSHEEVVLHPTGPPAIDANRRTPGTGHPFATSGFPKMRVRARGDRGAVELGYIDLEWRLSVAGHARRRLPDHGRTPRCVNVNVSHRPTTHRFLQSGESLTAPPASGTSPHHVPTGRRGTPTARGRGQRRYCVEASPVATARWQYRSAGDGKSTLRTWYFRGRTSIDGAKGGCVGAALHQSPTARFATPLSGPRHLTTLSPSQSHAPASAGEAVLSRGFFTRSAPRPTFTSTYSHASNQQLQSCV